MEQVAQSEVFFLAFLNGMELADQCDLGARRLPRSLLVCYRSVYALQGIAERNRRYAGAASRARRVHRI